MVFIKSIMGLEPMNKKDLITIPFYFYNSMILINIKF